VEQVNLPSSAGDMGVLANHVPAIAQLRPGVVEVLDGKATKKFFGAALAGYPLCALCADTARGRV
jgi:F-type H+-transporting ATPase subunit delta